MTTRISQSRLKDWRACHKKHDYKWNQHLKRRMPSKPLMTGTMIHDMLDAYAKKGIKAAMKVWKQHEATLKKFVQEDPETYEGLAEKVLGIFNNYIEYYEGDELTFEESEFEIVIDLGENMELVVHIDKVVTDEQKRLWILDHKGHKSIPGADDRMSDIQLVFYPWAWNRKFPKRQATGIIWDYLRTKVPVVPEMLKNGELSQRKNMDTTYDVYLKAIKDNKLDETNYTGMLEMLKGQANSFFERVSLPIANDHQLQVVIEDLMTTSREIRDHGKELKDRNLNTWTCRGCMFKDLCLAELKGLDSNFIRKSKFIVEDHDASEKEIND